MSVRWRRGVRGVAMALLGGLLAAAAVFADPPARVGRLAEVEGSVWVYSQQAGEWVGAELNRPITTSDRLSTEADGRAEIRVGSTTLRVGEHTEVEVLQLDDQRTRVQLHSGRMAARLRTSETARAFELDTDEGRFQPQEAGSYRFDRIDDVSHATVWRGRLLFEGDGNAVTVLAGQRGEMWTDGTSQYALTEPWHDDFERWALARDASEDRSASTRYVSPEMTGVEDLDRYGRWEQDPDVGPLWIPSGVAPGWVPYSTGRWIWMNPWGWTWVDQAPWGFAPFHYGRWLYRRNVWCWSPGRYVARPVWAPALVAWVGGPHVSLSVSVGHGPLVGWFPLAPRELFVPGYPVSPRYLRHLNAAQAGNVIDVTTILRNPQATVAQTRYLNRHLPGAVTVVPRQIMERREPVGPAAPWRRAPAQHDLDSRRIDGPPLATAPVPRPPIVHGTLPQRPRFGGGAGVAPPGRAGREFATPPQARPIGERPGLVAPAAPQRPREAPIATPRGPREQLPASPGRRPFERERAVPDRVVPDRVVPDRVVPRRPPPPAARFVPDPRLQPTPAVPQQRPVPRRPREFVPQPPVPVRPPPTVRPVPRPAPVPMAPIPPAITPVPPAIVPTPGAITPVPPGAARPAAPPQPRQHPRLRSIQERPPGHGPRERRQ